MSKVTDPNDDVDGESIAAVDDSGETAVLVVDDQESVADLYTEFLEDVYRVETAYGGEEALAIVDDDFDVVLLDRRMPGINGDAVLEEIRACGIDARVAMVTAVEPDEALLDLGFDDYVLKPIIQEELHDAVERLRLLSEYRSVRGELGSLRVKRNVLGVEVPGQLRSGSEEFRRLERDIANLERRLAAIEAELQETRLAAAIGG
ncbi:MAG: response regulator [Halobacteriales archaeon]